MITGSAVLTGIARTVAALVGVRDAEPAGFVASTSSWILKPTSAAWTT